MMATDPHPVGGGDLAAVVGSQPGVAVVHHDLQPVQDTAMAW